jgi:hypothetical protein
MPVVKARNPIRPEETANLIDDGYREFAAMAPSMLKKKVVEIVFLHWLTKFTVHVVRSAKEEERQAILNELPLQADGTKAWSEGFNNAIAQVRKGIEQRSELASN